MTDISPLNQTPPLEPLSRRGFLTTAVAAVVTVIVGLVPVVTGAIFFFDPVTRRKKSVGATGEQVDAEGYIKVATTDALAEDGSPRAFKVVADLQDFWNKFPNAEIGSVYLRRTTSGEITCFTARCPHLGCTVHYEPAGEEFVCPCHESSFGLDGHRSNQIPPRDMDALDVRVNDGEIWVKFQKFRAGIHEQQPI
jgi:Rieske Fe-S protein